VKKIIFSLALFLSFQNLFAAHKCNLCDKVYSNRPNLRKHQRSKHEENTIKSEKRCPFCLTVLHMNASIIKHIKKEHSLDQTDTSE
jgi:uncharacterized C2H2 Zn-finger protein